MGLWTLLQIVFQAKIVYVQNVKSLFWSEKFLTESMDQKYFYFFLKKTLVLPLFKCESTKVLLTTTRNMTRKKSFELIWTKVDLDIFSIIKGGWSKFADKAQLGRGLGASETGSHEPLHNVHVGQHHLHLPHHDGGHDVHPPHPGPALHLLQ